MPNLVEDNSSYPTIIESDVLYQRAARLIPAGTQTLAKGVTQYVNGVAPKFLRCGEGSHVWDVDGNEYIDYTMGVGPISLGYGYAAVDDAIRRQLEDGITFSLVHPLEVELAETLAGIIPNAEAVRYSKTGAEVTSAAVRIARAYTGRDRVLACGYHGWHDWYIGVTPRRRGVPQAVADLVHTFAYNDLDSVAASLDSSTACVILEPMVFDWPTEGFLAGLAELCRQAGALLIFDEMWTGFRLALGGAQEAFGVTPDLACYSKAIANGMPLAVLTGRQEMMAVLEEDVFFFTTFGGEALSLAAAQATIQTMIQHQVPHYLSEQGRRLQGGYNRIAQELSLSDYTGCKGHPARTVVTFDHPSVDPLLLKSFVQQELTKRGILWSGFHNVSFSHTDADVEYTLVAYAEVLEMLRNALTHNAVSISLRGEPVQPVFRKTGGFHTKPLIRSEAPVPAPVRP